MSTYTYIDEQAYGVYLNSWEHPELESILDQYKMVLSYDEDPLIADGGKIFVWVISTLKQLAIITGISSEILANDGRPFKPPRYPYRREINTEIIFGLTNEESEAINAIKPFIKSPNELGLIRRSTLKREIPKPNLFWRWCVLL